MEGKNRGVYLGGRKHGGKEGGKAKWKGGGARWKGGGAGWKGRMKGIVERKDGGG